MKENSDSRARFACRRTLRISTEENERLARPADTAGISVSEYIRRLYFGGWPITSRTDSQTIREFRRLGGLLKHNFEDVREAGGYQALLKMEATLETGRQAIERLSRDDRQKDEANELQKIQGDHDFRAGRLHLRQPR